MQYIQKIIGFFRDVRAEEIGVIAAEEILDFCLETIGDDLYKKAVADCKKIVKTKVEDIEFELDSITPQS